MTESNWKWQVLILQHYLNLPDHINTEIEKCYLEYLINPKRKDKATIKLIAGDICIDFREMTAYEKLPFTFMFSIKRVRSD